MAIRVSDQQLDEIEHGRESALIVHSKRTHKGYAVISESVYQQVRPLLQFVALRLDAEAPGEEDSPQWTEENNSRRVELINKKFNQGLTSVEKKELVTLNAEAEQFRDQTSGVRTEILELILAGLKRQDSKPITG
ncbi:MAG: hypothetical protein JWM11_3451 [Planctomycetaceae bacterium]|nr:hypothetical protein [Planctomycetaceae bacterium]